MRRRMPYFFDDLRRLLGEGFGIDVEPRSYTPFRTFDHGRLESYLDVIDAGSEIILTAELPGVNKEDIRINATEEGVEITVRSEEIRTGGDDFHRRMRTRYENFYASERMPHPINADKIKATYKNGVLEVRAPKKESKDRRKIKVE
ncbi:MAG: Hsp20/alpha crystallin family protein [Candidatus Altiarchaeota archaeon]